MSKYKTIKPLIVGLGVAGKRHLDAQLKLGFQTGVYSSHLKKKDPLGKQSNIIIFENLEEAVEWSNLVHICTPDDKHTEYVALALERGKAVFCEKTFTNSLENALSLQLLAHKYNNILLVAQNYRLTPSFAETKKMISSGILGKITRIKTTYLHDANEYQQRTAANKNKDFLYIGGSHAVDLACWIADEPVKKVQATATKNYPVRYKIILELVSGLSAQIELDASSPRSRSGTDLIVEGENGRLVSHNKYDQLLYYKTGNKTPRSIKLANNKTLTTALEVKIMDDFLLGRKNTYWPLPNVDEAVNTIKVLDEIQKVSSSLIRL